MNRRMCAVLLAVILAMLLVPVQTAEAASPSTDLTVHTDPGSLDIETLETTTYTAVVHNNSSDLTYTITPVFATDCAHLSVVMKVNGTAVTPGVMTPFTLKPGDNLAVRVELTGDKFLENGGFSGTLTLIPYVAAEGQTGLQPIVKTLSIHTASTISVEGDYNKILGIFGNPLPSPLNTAPVSAVLTLILWAIGAGIVAFVATRIAGRIIIRPSKTRNAAEEENYRNLRVMWRSVFAIAMMVGVMKCLNVLGLEESIVVTIDDFLFLIIAICGAKLVWDLYRAFVVEMGIRNDNDDYQSLTPLLLMLGKIVILFGAATVVLAIFGIDLVSLIAGLGLAATAISIGASSIISQFLSGLVILIDRPFTTGDKVMVGTDRTELIVKKVRIMSTELKNWNNEENYIIPNSTLTGNSVVNITKDNVNYKVYDYFSIAYDSDIGKAKSIMLECALDHPEVVTDGTFGVPDVKFMGVDRSGISLRLAYIVSDHENYGTYASQVRRAVYDRFNEEGIEIPYSQYTVNIDRTEITEAGSKDPDGM